MFLDEETEAERLEEIIGMDYGIQRAQAAVDFVSLDREALRNYDLRAMALADYKAELEFAREEGIKEGVEEGAKRREIEIARNLKAMEMSYEQISQLTGLIFEEIEQL
jgi:predicted transposase/invertase (TIGR01784 family)